MKTGCFGSKRLKNHFTQRLGLEAQYEISDDESDIEGDGTTKTNRKEGGNDGNGKVADIDTGTVDLTDNIALQGFASNSDKK